MVYEFSPISMIHELSRNLLYHIEISTGFQAKKPHFLSLYGVVLPVITKDYFLRGALDEIPSRLATSSTTTARDRNGNGLISVHNLVAMVPDASEKADAAVGTNRAWEIARKRIKREGKGM
jgi:hypothetical protein